MRKCPDQCPPGRLFEQGGGEFGERLDQETRSPTHKLLFPLQMFPPFSSDSLLVFTHGDKVHSPKSTSSLHFPLLSLLSFPLSFSLFSFPLSFSRVVNRCLFNFNFNRESPSFRDNIVTSLLINIINNIIIKLII